MTVLALVDPTTIKSMTERQVLDTLGNFKANRKEGNIDQEDKEGRQIISTYKEFINWKPRPFYSDEGVNGLIHWIKMMERKYANDCCVEFTTCTFIGKALTRWNTQFKTLCVNVSYKVSWGELKKLMIREFCSKGRHDMSGTWIPSPNYKKHMLINLYHTLWGPRHCMSKINWLGRQEDWTIHQGASSTDSKNDLHSPNQYLKICYIVSL